MVEFLKLPVQLTDYHFRVVKARGKAPNVESNWQNKNNYRATQENVNSILSSGLNYGFTCPTGFCCFVDADTLEIQRSLDEFTWTFRYSTGTPGHYQYVYFIEDESIGCVPLVDGAYIKGKGGFAVGPGSTHPNGNIYGKEIRDAPVAVVRKGELLEVLSSFVVKTKETGSSTTLYERGQRVSNDQVTEVVEELIDLWNNADGRRHDLTLAIIGFLEKRRWRKEDVRSALEQLVSKSNKGREHLAQVNYAYGRTGKKWGLPMILRIQKEVESHVT